MWFKGLYIKITGGEDASPPAGTRHKVREEHTKVKEELEAGFSHLFGLLDDTLEQMQGSRKDEPNGHRH